MEGKKSLPHLFNDGKPSEMSAKDFYNFINWLDKNDGIINENNTQINEKLDGSSQFFGVNDKGFFWEKFGSDEKFYSIEEIPEIFARYKPLFSDMKSALYDFLKNYNVDEIKVQIEVIGPYGAKNEDNYLINLVPYKKSAFKENGLLSIIQVLINGSDDSSDVEVPVIKEHLEKTLPNYTIFDCYHLAHFDIDLSKPAIELLKILNSYPFEKESEKFKINLTEIEDVLDLPTRKFNLSYLKEIFAEYKKIFNDEILNQMKGKAGSLSENGMFEGLAFTLDNGLKFKVNSPEFKLAFQNHKKELLDKRLNRVSEARSKSKDSFTSFFDEDELPEKSLIKFNDTFLNELFFIIKKDLKIYDDKIICDLKGTNIIRTFDSLTGRERVLNGSIVDERKDNIYISWLPLDSTSSNDSGRIYARGIAYIDKKHTFATVNDGLNFPQHHEYIEFYLRKHNVVNMNGDTKIQECMQGIAIELAKSVSSREELKEKIKEKIEKDGYSLINLSGGAIKVTDFNEEKLLVYLDAASKTGMAFIDSFGDIVDYSTKVYHPDVNGTLKYIIEFGKKFLNGMAKDCWNPTDILVTDYTVEDIKPILERATDLSSLNDIIRDLIKQNSYKKCFIPLSLKLNTSNDREESEVEPINLEDKAEDFHVTSHYVNTSKTGNEIDIYAHISGHSYKFCIRNNGSTAPVIEGQTISTSSYLNNEKFIDDETENRDIIDRGDVDIEAYKEEKKNNTTSFLGKSKTILFSIMNKKEFEKQKKNVNFDKSIRNQFHEGSLPWRLIELAEKIENPLNFEGVKNYNQSKANLVAALAKDFAKLIVLQKWSTEEAIIYILTCSKKENYGVFNKFAPLYKIS